MLLPPPNGPAEVILQRYLGYMPRDIEVEANDMEQDAKLQRYLGYMPRDMVPVLARCSSGENSHDFERLFPLAP